MREREQLLFMVGRRLGIFLKLEDINDACLSAPAEQAVVSNKVTPDNVEDLTAEMMTRFI